MSPVRRLHYAPSTRDLLAGVLVAALAPCPAAAAPPRVADEAADAAASESRPDPSPPPPVSETAEPAEPGADPPVTIAMTDEQRRLHARGEAAARAGDWAAAARYFRAAVSLGGFNLGFLGLGEALARLGRCAEAATALDAVPASPAVPEAPARFADAMANAQRQALGRTCPGRLVVDCAAPMSRFRIIGGAEHDCGEPVELPAGRYRLRAGPDAMAVTLDAWVVGVETTRVTLRLPRPLPAEAILGPAPVEPAEVGDPWFTAGAVTLGIGAAGLLVGAGLHGVTLSAREDANAAELAVARGDDSARADFGAAFDRHEDLRRVTIGAYIGAGVVALSGLVILLVDPGDRLGPRPGSSLAVGAGGLSGRF